MTKFKPIVTSPVAINDPVVSEKIKDQHNWSFSFRYFNQIDFFGLGSVDPKWFVSLLDRLRDLCKEDINSFFRNHALKDGNRYHIINWEARNIPIKRTEIDWVDRNIIENEEDYPFFQFQISTGLGRVIGFWNEDYRFFNIVLLDPKHNMQPSKKFNYRVDDTSILYCEMTSLLIDVDRAKGLKCIGEGCKCKEVIHQIPTKLNRGKFVYFQLDDEYYDYFLEATKEKSIKELIEIGIISTI